VGRSGQHRHTTTPTSPTTLRTILIAAASIAAVAIGTISIVVTGTSSASSRSRAKAAYSSRTPDRADRGAARTPLATPTPASETPEPTETPPAAQPAQKKQRARKILSRGACEASYYASGGRTASGEAYDPDALTAAHRTLPLGSKVRVINRDNDRSVIVRINDRGPFVAGRCLDLSSAAMSAVGGLGSGVIPVRYEVLAKV
jgi:rare lipoprotein A (peptidoglycan hydrolase)